jgi:stage III sporulation protein AA
VYTLEEELKRGYITVSGGHRVGLAGKTVLEQGRVKHLKEIASFNIRIAREVRGAARELMPKLYDAEAGTIRHTLIVSPPQQGKTTLIRDIARALSTGDIAREDGAPSPPLKVGIVDERSEIAACIKGVPTFDVGPRTDVLDGCPKAEGMMMMIRAMSPDVIIVDEIGRPEDAEAIHEALHAGIRIVATAHGQSFRDIAGRPMLRELVSEQIFQRYVVIGHTYGIGRVFRIYDRDGRMIDAMIVRNAHA